MVNDLSKIAKEIEVAANVLGPDTIIETKESLSLNEALKLRDDYFSNYTGGVGLHPLNPNVPPELSAYVFCVRGSNYDA